MTGGIGGCLIPCGPPGGPPWPPPFCWARLVNAPSPSVTASRMMFFILFILSRVAVAQPGPAARPPQLLLRVGGQRGLRRGNRREATVSHQRPAHCNRAAQVTHSFLSHAATLRRATLREREGRIIFGECPISQRGASLAFVGGRREVGEIRSPKTEIRRKPEIRNPKT